MKWNKTLTAEEITLIALRHENKESIQGLIPPPPASPDEKKKLKARWDQYTEARQIKEALEREICLVDPLNTNADDSALLNTTLIISNRAESEEGWLLPEKCLITRESAALWFYDMDIEKAKLLHPRVERLTTTTDTPVKVQNEQESKQQAEIRTSSGTILESLGLMSLILSKEKTSFSNGDRPNAKGIAEAVKRKAEELNIGVDQISNLNRDITTGLRAVELKRKG